MHACTSKKRIVADCRFELAGLTLLGDGARLAALEVLHNRQVGDHDVRAAFRDITDEARRVLSDARFRGDALRYMLKVAYAHDGQHDEDDRDALAALRARVSAGLGDAIEGALARVNARWADTNPSQVYGRGGAARGDVASARLLQAVDRRGRAHTRNPGHAARGNRT